MNDQITTLDQIPNSPLDMPPPFWRGSSAIFHILDALEKLPHLLSKLISVHEQTELALQEYWEQYPDELDNENDIALEKFAGICGELWQLEHRIKLKAEIASLMSAIQVEDDINRFCTFNLHKEIAESVESLSPSEKLLIASSIIGKENTKGTAVYEAIKKLSTWRNAFAHGHCVDRPTKSLRHNHLISPNQYPSVPDTLFKMQELLGCYLRVEEHLRLISVNPYTAGKLSDVKNIREFLKEIEAFRFQVSSDSNDIYDIKYQKT